MERQGSHMGVRLNMGYTGMKQNYSFLFQSMSGNSNLNFLSDYMSIKNGSYGKLMKAYYGKGNKISKEAASIVDEKKKTLSTPELPIREPLLCKFHATACINRLA